MIVKFLPKERKKSSSSLFSVISYNFQVFGILTILFIYFLKLMVNLILCALNCIHLIINIFDTS